IESPAAHRAPHLFPTRRSSDLPEYVYILLNKPRGVVSANKREAHEKRRLVRKLVPHKGHLFTVGRLDADSEGLVLLTNDGELAEDRKSTRLNSSHVKISYAVFC